MSGSDRRVEGKVAVVTGGATGIGRAIAMRLAQEGATVYVGDVHQRFSQPTEDALREVSPGSRVIQCDVSKADEVQALMGQVMADHGRIDVLVNNAGIPGTLAPVDELEDEAWDRVIAVNLRGVFLCTKYAVPGLLAAPHGVVVNTASTFGMIGAPNTPAYAAAKGGVIGLTRQLAVDLGPRGIRVNAISPGYVDNDMDQRRERMSAEDAAANLQAREDAAALQPIGRQADVSEIAAAFAFVASDDASFMTGAIVPVDGGCTAFFNLGRRS